MTRYTEKCPLSVLPGVRIKRVNFRKNVRAFCRDKRNCPYKAGDRITAVISHTRPPTIFSHFENCVLVDVNQMYP